MKILKFQIGVLAVMASAGLFRPTGLRAHCDTLDGPVVVAAKAALEAKDVTPVLKWVKKQAEPEIKSAFEKTLAVRSQSQQAQELADQYFFETLVRIHRMGEGAPFTGLKPAGSDPGPAITGAERAIQSGDITPVLKMITEEAAAGARKRLTEVREKQAHAEQSVVAGREYVAAYVDYIHYLEGLHQAAKGASAHEEFAEPQSKSAGTPGQEHSQHGH